MRLAELSEYTRRAEEAAERAEAALGEAKGLRGEVAELRKGLEERIAREERPSATLYLGKVVREIRRPDGSVEVEYGLTPSDEAARKQTDAVFDTVMPEMLGELKEIRRDVASLGSRFVAFLESSVLPRVAKAGYLPIKPTRRTVEEREREIEEHERGLAEREVNIPMEERK